VVRIDEYEGFEYLLVDARTGARTTVAGPPQVSPNGERFACDMVNMVIGNIGIQVWRVKPGGFELEYDYSSIEGFIPGPIKWLDDASIQVAHVDPSGKVLGQVIYRREGRPWTRQP